MEQHFEYATYLYNTYNAYKFNRWCTENVDRGDYYISNGTTIKGLWMRPCIIYSFRHQADLLVFKLVNGI